MVKLRAARYSELLSGLGRRRECRVQPKRVAEYNLPNGSVPNSGRVGELFLMGSEMTYFEQAKRVIDGDSESLDTLAGRDKVLVFLLASIAESLEKLTSAISFAPISEDTSQPDSAEEYNLGPICGCTFDQPCSTCNVGPLEPTEPDRNEMDG